MMPTVGRPSDVRCREFLASEAARGFSYPCVGITASGGTARGFVQDENRVCLGQGEAVFEAACEALRQWRQFPSGWTEIFPASAPLEVGVNVAVLLHLFGL